MKKNIFTFLAIFINSIWLIFTYANELSRNEFVRVSYVDGNGVINHGFNESQEAVSVNSILTEGDLINSYENSKIELIFGNGVILRMNENSNLQLLSLSQSKNSPIIIKLISGDIIIDSSISSIQENNFRIDTPDCSIYLIQEGYFRVIYFDYTDIMVYRGVVEVATQNNSFNLSSGQRLFNAASSEANPEYFNTFANDDFSRWNEYRQNYYNNKRIQREYTEDINPYDIIELEEYGIWRYEPPYGYIWVPYVAGGWRPYLYGHWVWFPSGWAWVSYEPWGWAPYHYGRWGFSISIGWFWIPRPIFGFAWVSWYSWGDYIGWCPLDYYDRPIFFDPPSHSGYYRPNPKSWTIIPKNKLGSKDLYKYRINEIEKFDALKIEKEKILKTSEFNIRQKNLPTFKSKSLPHTKIESKDEYKEFYKKPLEKFNKDIKIYNKKDNSAEGFKKFKEDLNTYEYNQTKPSREYQKPYYKKSENPYPSYEQWREKDFQKRDSYVPYNYKQIKPDDESLPYHSYTPSKPYHQEYGNNEQEHFYRNNDYQHNYRYKSLSPSYRDETRKMFENIYRGRTGNYKSSPAIIPPASGKPPSSSKPIYKKKD